jgi:hypothetical protein
VTRRAAADRRFCAGLASASRVAGLASASRISGLASASRVARLASIRSLGGLDLNEGHPELGQPVSQLWFVLPKSPRQPLDEGGEGIDGQPRLVELGWLQTQVEGRQLEQAEGVVGDDQVDRRAGQLFLELL